MSNIRTLGNLRRAGLGLFVAFAVLATACGGDSGEDAASTPTAEPTATPEATAAPASAPDGTVAATPVAERNARQEPEPVEAEATPQPEEEAEPVVVPQPEATSVPEPTVVSQPAAEQSVPTVAPTPTPRPTAAPTSEPTPTVVPTPVPTRPAVLPAPAPTLTSQANDGRWHVNDRGDLVVEDLPPVERGSFPASSSWRNRVPAGVEFVLAEDYAEEYLKNAPRPLPYRGDESDLALLPPFEVTSEFTSAMEYCIGEHVAVANGGEHPDDWQVLQDVRLADGRAYSQAVREESLDCYKLIDYWGSRVTTIPYDERCVMDAFRRKVDWTLYGSDLGQWWWQCPIHGFTSIPQGIPFLESCLDLMRWVRQQQGLPEDSDVGGSNEGLCNADYNLYLSSPLGRDIELVRGVHAGAYTEMRHCLNISSLFGMASRFLRDKFPVIGGWPSNLAVGSIICYDDILERHGLR